MQMTYFARLHKNSGALEAEGLGEQRGLPLPLILMEYKRIKRENKRKGTPSPLCVEIGFYADFSWESRCNVEINV